jgi:hypothetical protein
LTHYGNPNPCRFTVSHCREVTLLQQGFLAAVVQLLCDDGFKVDIQLKKVVNGARRIWKKVSKETLIVYKKKWLQKPKELNSKLVCLS